MCSSDLKSRFDAQCATQGVSGIKAAFLAHIPVEFDRGGAFEQYRGQALASGNAFGDLEHKNSDVPDGAHIVAQAHVQWSALVMNRL